MKKIALVVPLLLVCLFGCKKEKPAPVSASILEKYTSDSAYILDKRALIVGVAEYRPMDYREGGEWKGFDAELATKFAASLGLQVFFREINWSDKVTLLENGTIDCIWNGMTRTDALQKTIACSRPYLVNSQVVVLPVEKVKEYKHESECSGLLFTIESGSAAEELLIKQNWRYVVAKNQYEALQQVLAERADAAIIDSILASDVHNLSDKLGFSIRLNYEQLCVGLRANSDLLDRLNQFLQQSEVDGTIGALKIKYGIE